MRLRELPEAQPELVPQRRQPRYFVAELLGVDQAADESHLGRGGRRHPVGLLGPPLRQGFKLFAQSHGRFQLGLDLGHRGVVGGAFAHPEHHHLLELLLRRPEYPESLEVRGEHPAELPIQGVLRHDQHHHAAEHQQRVGQVVEQLLQPLAALAVLDAAGMVGDQVAVGWVEKQQPELALADDGVLEVAVDAAVQQALAVPGPLLVVLDAVGLGAVGAEMRLALGQGHALAAARVEDAQGALGYRLQSRQSARSGVRVGGEIAVLGEIAREALKHECCHGCLLVKVGGIRPWPVQKLWGAAAARCQGRKRAACRRGTCAKGGTAPRRAGPDRGAAEPR